MDTVSPALWSGQSLCCRGCCLCGTGDIIKTLFHLRTEKIRLTGTLRNQHTMALFTYLRPHVHTHIHAHKCAYIQTKGKQGLVHIFQFLCSISVFLFCFGLFFSVMFVAFSTVERCFNLLYRVVYFFCLVLFSLFSLFFFLYIISLRLFERPVCHVTALLRFHLFVLFFKPLCSLRELFFLTLLELPGHFRSFKERKPLFVYLQKVCLV